MDTFEGKLPEKIEYQCFCVNCQKPFGLMNHLLEKAKEEKGVVTWGPWYCDHCGYGMRGTISPDGLLTVKVGEDIRYFTLNQLEYEGITVIVQGLCFSKIGESLPEERVLIKENRFFYEEYACPENYLRKVADVVGDPHGLFNYVKTKILSRDDDICKIAKEWGDQIEKEKKKF